MTNKALPYSHKGNLTAGSVRGHLIRLTVPMIWSILAVISVQIVDIYFIGLLGTEKLAAISFTFPITMLITHLVFGVNIALSSVVSRMIGEGRTEEAKRIVLHGLMMAFTLSCSLALLFYAFLDPLFRMLGADAQTLPVIRDYMPLWLVASALLAIPVNGNSAIRASGDSLTPALVMCSIALMNAILAPLLILGLCGLPALGVRGAALATLLAYCFGLALGLYALIVKKKMVDIKSFHMDRFSDSFRRLAVIAVPAGITNIIQPGMGAFVIFLLSVHGTAAVAAYGIATRVEAFVLILIIALALGMAPLVGQNWGAGIYKRVHETIKLSIAFNFIWSFSAALILGAFSKNIAGAFSNDPAVINLAALFFKVVPFSYAFGNLVYGWSSAFNAMGLPKRAFILIVTKSIFFTIPCVYLGSIIYGVPGIFMSLTLVNLFTGTVFNALSWRACRRLEGLEQLAGQQA